MDHDAFLRQMEEMLEMEPQSLSGAAVLAELDAWDSLAMLGVIALADSSFQKVLDTPTIRQAVTVDDLYRLVSA
jgi:hypothetical protein